jgi:hypothetical protein
MHCMSEFLLGVHALPCSLANIVADINSVIFLFLFIFFLMIPPPKNLGTPPSPNIMLNLAKQRDLKKLPWGPKTLGMTSEGLTEVECDFEGDFEYTVKYTQMRTKDPHRCEWKFYFFRTSFFVSWRWIYTLPGIFLKFKCLLNQSPKIGL